jgi:NADH dehydrogenase FAD-containing subunit
MNTRTIGSLVTIEFTGLFAFLILAVKITLTTTLTIDKKVALLLNWRTDFLFTHLDKIIL